MRYHRRKHGDNSTNAAKHNSTNAPSSGAAQAPPQAAAAAAAEAEYPAVAEAPVADLAEHAPSEAVPSAEITVPANVAAVAAQASVAAAPSLATLAGHDRSAPGPSAANLLSAINSSFSAAEEAAKLLIKDGGAVLGEAAAHAPARSLAPYVYLALGTGFLLLVAAVYCMWVSPRSSGARETSGGGGGPVSAMRSETAMRSDKGTGIFTGSKKMARIRSAVSVEGDVLDFPDGTPPARQISPDQGRLRMARTFTGLTGSLNTRGGTRSLSPSTQVSEVWNCYETSQATSNYFRRSLPDTSSDSDEPSA